VIEELTLQGFKSYPAARTETVGFTRGVNKVSGRNAAGKTTLLEAVLFGLYGDVPGVNKQDLVPLGGSGLDVTIKLRSPLTGQRAVIHREGTLTKDGGFRTTKSVMTVEGEDHAYSRERDIQSRLRELLGIGRNTFLNVVYAQQNEFIEIHGRDPRTHRPSRGPRAVQGGEAHPRGSGKNIRERHLPGAY
jgi:exonuclease SbcC